MSLGLRRRPSQTAIGVVVAVCLFIIFTWAYVPSQWNVETGKRNIPRKFESRYNRAPPVPDSEEDTYDSAAEDDRHPADDTPPADNKPSTSNEDVKITDKYEARYVPRDNITGERWIVVTTIASPTEDVKFLAKLPGWRVVVVGDTKTPSDWSYPNCAFLSVEDQMRLGLNVVSSLPVKSYARKNVGYLYAIAHGAKVIYETDDDNRPTDKLKGFVLNSVTSGLMYDGQDVFNPYRHFGQPTLWPRGYPLSYVGENNTYGYLLDDIKTPFMQQGLVNGDPDMDAIFRLTRKKTTSVLNVTFDGRAPPGIVPRNVFAPFNSQNTLFLYDAFWALLIPTTVTFRVCDIWRGYWAQRLIWEIGGNLGFFPPNAFQKRNAHNYLQDAVEEKDLYFKTERLIQFLRSWKCKSYVSFFDCVVDLSDEMAKEEFWQLADAELVRKWIADLKQIGYKEPKRVFVNSDLNGKAGLTSSKVHYWPSVQTPPLKFTPWKGGHAVSQYLDTVTSLCSGANFSVSRSTLHSPSILENVLLIIVFDDHQKYDNIQATELLYSLHFPHRVYCGPNYEAFQAFSKSLHNHVTFVEVDVDKGFASHRCLSEVMRMRHNVDGYLYIRDSVLLNAWTLTSLPVDKIWFPPVETTSNNDDVFLNKIPQGLPAYSMSISDLARDDSNGGHARFMAMLEQNAKGKKNVYFHQDSRIAYIPYRLREDFIYFNNAFSKKNLHVEMALPAVLGGIEKLDNFYELRGTYLTSESNSRYQMKFKRRNHFMTPVDTYKEIAGRVGQRFYCHIFFPLALNQGQI